MLIIWLLPLRVPSIINQLTPHHVRLYGLAVDDTAPPPVGWQPAVPWRAKCAGSSRAKLHSLPSLQVNGVHSASWLTAWYTSQFGELSEETLCTCAQLSHGKPTSSCSCRAFAVPAGNNCIHPSTGPTTPGIGCSWQTNKTKMIFLKFWQCTFAIGRCFCWTM